MASAVSLIQTSGCAGEEATHSATRPADEKAPPGVAVVELFTSEGCSSCPSADEVLASLAADARAKQRPVFPLAFHVDYWNRLGWADPFSAKAYTDRQYAYAAAAKSNQVYTPQMIVNGTAEFVGSDAKEAARRIESALAIRARATVELKATVGQDGAVVVEYTVSNATAGATLCLAFVERGLETRVLRGENAGRTLRHENVVRAFAVVPAADLARGKLQLRPPAGANAGNAAVVGYVQSAKDMAVLGAAAVELGAAPRP